MTSTDNSFDKIILRFFYAAQYFLFIVYIFPQIGNLKSSAVLQWPLFWVPYLPKAFSCFILLSLFIAAPMVAILSSSKWPPLLSAISLLFMSAIMSSSGGVTHLFQFWLWAQIAIILSPHGQKVRAAQGIVLLLYFLSGFWKLEGGLRQLINGEPSIFSNHGMLSHLASEIIRSNAKPILKDWWFNHEWIGSIFGFSTVILQLGLLPLFLYYKNNLKIKYFIGLSLLSFHLGTALFLSITYPTNVLLVLILFLV